MRISDWSSDVCSSNLLAQIVVGADATDDDLRILGRLGRVDRDRAAIGLRPALRLADGTVVDGQFMPRLRQMPRNRAAHDAQADKRDFSHMPRSVGCAPRKP